MTVPDPTFASLTDLKLIVTITNELLQTNELRTNAHRQTRRVNELAKRSAKRIEEASS